MRFSPSKVLPRGRRGSGSPSLAAGQGPSANGNARNGHPPVGGEAGAHHGQSLKPPNSVFLGGVLAADPQPDRGRDGRPVLLLLIAFPAPDQLDTAAGTEAASCEVEVPQPVAERNGRLEAGETVFITGSVSGGGGILASAIRSGPAPNPAEV